MSTSPNPEQGWANPTNRPQVPAVPGGPGEPDAHGQDSTPTSSYQAASNAPAAMPQAAASTPAPAPQAAASTPAAMPQAAASTPAPTQQAATNAPTPSPYQAAAGTRTPTYQTTAHPAAPYQHQSGATHSAPYQHQTGATHPAYQTASSATGAGHGAGGTTPPTAFGGGSTGWPAQQPVPAQPVKRPRTWLAVTAAALLAAALASGGTAALLHDSSSTTSLSQSDSPVTVPVSADGTPDWEAVAEQVRPSVVAITFTSREGSGAGSGVIIDTSGLILTNNHVVADAQTLTVTLSDGRIYDAEIVGTDATTDLAVIRITDAPDDLQAASLGTSDDLAVGESVMAVGNPLGLDSTATTGIISALDRPVSASGTDSQDTVVTNAIQIDAAVNPGNSGGPLFDANGLVIGITSSIATLSESSGSIGLGFAIPIDLAANVADQLIANGTAQHAYLGVALTDDTATADGVTRTGAAVAQVSAGTPAADAGLQVGDVIVQIDDHTVNGAESLTGWVRTYNSGDKVTLTVIRNGQSMQVEATLASREASAN